MHKCTCTNMHKHMPAHAHLGALPALLPQHNLQHSDKLWPLGLCTELPRPRIFPNAIWAAQGSLLKCHLTEEACPAPQPWKPTLCLTVEVLKLKESGGFLLNVLFSSRYL